MIVYNAPKFVPIPVTNKTVKLPLSMTFTGKRAP